MLTKSLSFYSFYALLALYCASHAMAVEYPERMLNKTEPMGLLKISDGTKALHSTLFISDLHADTLLWDRDLRKRSDAGHIDLPRLMEGNVALQVFAAVTKIPIGINIQSNSSHTDQLGLLMMLQAWPQRTWFDIKQRAIYQTEKLTALEEQANSAFRIIRTRGDLALYQQDRAKSSQQTAGLLALEGVQPLEGELANLDVFFNLGYRMMGLTHFFDNEAAGSAHGSEKEGLTAFGKALIKQMEKKGIVIDLAHASPKTINDVMAMAAKPVVVSHTGVDGVCPSVRNLSDEQLKTITKTGGLIGIGYWPAAICDITPTGIGKAIRYTADVVGVDHVALGSDFNGSVTTAIDTSNLVQVTEALRQQGFKDSEIRKIMGGNVVRVLMQTLPE